MALFYSLEGHSFAGKTTLIRHLEKVYDFNQVGEYDSFVDNTNDYPPHPHKSAEIATHDVDFFADLDLKREHRLRHYLASEKTVVMDRSFISLILFQKYTKHLNRKNEYDAYHYAKEKYYKLLSSETLSMPDLMIYMAPESLEVHTSRLTREVSSDMLRSTDAYTYFNQEYSRILEAYANRKRLLTLTSNNSQENLDTNAQKVSVIKINPLTPIERSELIEEIFKII